MEGKVAEEVTGGCQCGRVRYRVSIDNDDAYLCHCRMCQRATGGVFAAFKNVLQADVVWEGEPDQYASSPIATRGYCRECGTPLTFKYPDSAKIDLTVGSFDDPARFKPVSHFGAESMHEQWIDSAGLPRQRSEDYKPLADRWKKAIGKLPD
jgi:hypothetical protein